MKINYSSQTRCQGSVLVTTMTILALAAVVIGSYFMLVQDQAANVARGQTWNSALPIAEAGLEEGLSLLNQGSIVFLTASNAWNWTNNIGGTTGWSALSNNATSLTRYVSGSNYYTVTINISSGTPVITSSGTAPYTSVPWIFSASTGPLIAAVGNVPVNTPTNVNLGRKIQVTTVLPPLFTADVVTKSNVTVNGNNNLFDSYNSGNPIYSTLGQYDPAKHEANGNVGTDSSIGGTLSLGNGNIYGHVMTGPGTQSSAVNVGPNGAVGNIAWNTIDTGIEPGYWRGDFNVNVPDVPAPPVGSPLPAPVGGVITLTGGNYTTASDPGVPINVTGPSTLWVQGSYSANLTIATTNNASLIFYVGTTSGSGDSLSLGGNGTINSPGYAANLQLYGLPSLNSISVAGNAQFTGTIYAPEANVRGSGGGNNPRNMSGSMIVNSVTLNGHWGFHYDEALANNGPLRSWIISNYQELSYP